MHKDPIHTRVYKLNQLRIQTTQKTQTAIFSINHSLRFFARNSDIEDGQNLSIGPVYTIYHKTEPKCNIVFQKQV